MATYAIGDVQGCCDELEELLALLRFDPAVDRLLFVGDLVNRGPRSLDTLRLVRSLHACSTVVLGNHDFHLLTVAEGFSRLHRRDTIAPLLDAPDRDELLRWLRTRPLVVGEDAFLLVHAGLLPSWSAHDAAGFSREVEEVLAGPDYRAFLRVLYGDTPRRWSRSLTGWDRLRAIVNTCTRLRFCRPDDTMEFREKRGSGYAPPGFRPWFLHPERRSANVTVVCGHWSTLELMLLPNVLMLDSGCVWGGTLTAVRLEDRRVFQVASRQALAPKPFG